MLGLITAATGILGGVTSTIGGILKSGSGARMQRNAQDAIDSYQRQTLQNSFSDVGVSRLGADLMRQENARMAGTSVDALQSAGVRGLSMIGQVQQGNNAMNQNLATDLDRQQQQINMARAQDDSRIRSLQERREEQDLAGLGRQLEVGRQDKFGGLQDIGQGLLSASMMGASAMGGAGGAAAGAGGGGLSGMGALGSGMGGSPYSQKTLDSLFSVKPSGMAGLVGTPMNPITGLPY